MYHLVFSILPQFFNFTFKSLSTSTLCVLLANLGSINYSFNVSNSASTTFSIFVTNEQF